MPDVCVSNMRSVTWARRGSLVGLKSGRYVCTGSSIATRPFSYSCRKAVVVATLLVNDARSKIVSSVIGSAGAGDPSSPGSSASLREPKA